MVHKIAGLSIAFVLAAGLALAVQDTKKDGKKLDFTTAFGSFESYKDEILTLKVDNKDKEFKVPGDTQVGYSTGKEDKTTIQKAKEHLKDVKKGSIVAVTLDSQGKKVLAVGVVVSELPTDKKKQEKKKDE
ncbi:MAG: hypothetical protein ACYC3I_09300 [Gemmataceae bacterium]